MFKTIVLLLFCFWADCCMAVEETNTTNGPNETFGIRMSKRKSLAKLLSFEALDEDIKLGLKFQLPFLKVPMERRLDSNGNEPALININTAALLSTGLLATFSALISLVFRKYVVLGKEKFPPAKHQRADNILDYQLWSILNNFKLAYTNSSGTRVGTSLDGLFDMINETFEKNDINLSSCLQKAICRRMQLSVERVKEGGPSGVDKIIYGLMTSEWWRHFLRHTSFKESIDLESSKTTSSSNQQQNKINCDSKYQQCKWSKPEDNLIDIIKTYLVFT